MTEKPVFRSYPLNCSIGDKVVLTKDVEGVKYADGDLLSVHNQIRVQHKEGSKGEVVNIVNYGIDILLENGEPIRIMNSKILDYFKIL